MEKIETIVPKGLSGLIAFALMCCKAVFSADSTNSFNEDTATLLCNGGCRRRGCTEHK